MGSNKLYADSLAIAAETLGGSEELARRLGVNPKELARWMWGGEPAPLEAFLTALDIIAERPYLARPEQASGVQL